jgi:hypothetical protein
VANESNVAGGEQPAQHGVRVARINPEMLGDAPLGVADELGFAAESRKHRRIRSCIPRLRHAPPCANERAE